MRISSALLVLQTLRRPEYTGGNRCVPCTAVNLGLAAVATGLTALVSLPAAAVVGTLALASIYFRGYLLPGTPALTKRYLPARVLRWFGKAPRSIGGGEVDPGVILSTADVLVDRPGAVDVSLTPGFVTAWRSRTRELLAEEDTTRRVFAELLDVPDSTVSVSQAGRGLAASIRGERVGVWESPTAFAADIAAMELLAERVPTWELLSVSARNETTGALRVLADTCPDCAGRTALEEETVTSCCGNYRVVAVTCEDCGARLVELPVTDEMSAAGTDHGEPG